MKEFVPNYFHKFKCIADQCQHSCCIGWEIDIDNKTLEYYKSVQGDMGKRLSDNIALDTTPHFILQKDERCPFLKQNGLCDIYIKLGQDALCEICAAHPRFKNFYGDFVEVGLGLCCEAAVKIILEETEPLCILHDYENVHICAEEKNFLQYRDIIFKKMQNRTLSFKDRYTKISKEFGFAFNLLKVLQLYKSLERLDNKWTELLENVSGYNFSGKIFEDKELQIPFEQLFCYFLYRHMSDAMWSGEYDKIVRFSLSGCGIIAALCEKNGKENLQEYARLFSAEIEYSTENMDIIFDSM